MCVASAGLEPAAGPNPQKPRDLVGDTNRHGCSWVWCSLSDVAARPSSGPLTRPMKRTAGRPSSHALFPESVQESERAVVVTVWWHCLAAATLHPTDLFLWCVPRQELNLNMPRGREKHYNLTYNLVCLCLGRLPPPLRRFDFCGVCGYRTCRDLGSLSPMGQPWLAGDPG